ncbi:MAG: nucleoside triphosphate pyrophosphohydrolase [Dehalococcoidales bacterium]|nr:nucleoside triphosphate pyrophosphohydrolase [Dehalococcoidales bacterium]
MPIPEDLGKFESLVSIIARLRAPDGCPWDREQTHTTLRVNLLSEAYEVLEALDAGDDDELCEELGDLLLQIVLHAQIARDEGEFEIADVIRGICTKIIGRHPHIFGDTEVNSSREVMVNWEALKKIEKPERASMLEGVPKAMPSLDYAYEIQRRVARVGFDWEDMDGVIEKLAEEVREIREANDKDELADEYGDLLFTLANIIRRDGIDPETALREANRKFYKRFAYMEELCRQRGYTFGELTFKEQNDLWNEAKDGVDAK